jgi:hypothetical protein
MTLGSLCGMSSKWREMAVAAVVRAAGYVSGDEVAVAEEHYGDVGALDKKVYANGGRRWQRSRCEQIA